ncbi:DEAD/DEAH box helicase [Saccharopolyspora taberi]|uniref:DEAD/DEAH box helicase n=1 Tax=Saccharopolyspora taberi TaxID=60895 RepID=A0ABN3VL04_9PSEU
MLEAVPLLQRADAPPERFWAAVAVLALRLVARGRIVPSVATGGFDAWRVGPLDPEDAECVRRLAAHQPVELVRAFLDAVADELPRTADSAGVEPHPVGDDVRLSLRLEIEPDGPSRAVVQAHSLADPARVVDARELPPGDVVPALRRAARTWPPLERLLDDAVPDALPLDDDEIEDLLSGAAARLAGAGVDVHWPKELVRDVRPFVHASGRSFVDDMRFEWGLSVDGEPLSEAELDELASAQRPIVRLRGRWALVDAGTARRAGNRELEPALGALVSGSTEVDGAEVEVRGMDALRKQLTAESEIPQPPGLNATLRHYQLDGLRWLDRLLSLGLGGCLADDMGLGKTITLIAVHLHRGGGPALIVCPASLLGNWEREIERFAPGVGVRRFHGTRRSLDDVRGFVLTTYGTLRVDAEALAGVRWGMVVADEAQHVKNHRSGTAKALRAIPCRARVALTGTPVENDLADLWSILDWTTPGLLGTAAEFRRHWVRRIEQEPGAAQRFSRLVRPFLLRRRKSDPGVAPELPPKTETDLPVQLTPEQAGLYAAVVRETMAEIRESEGIQRRGLVVRLLTSLKQICNHPAHFLGGGELEGRSGKLELLDELLGTILAEGGSVLVFTQYVEMAKLLERHLAGQDIATRLLHGGTPVPQRERMVREFQEGAVPVFLLSLKAAGTGLNLTRADHVVHYDRWWNPAVEDQATDRAHRIGRTRPVQVHRMITEGTVEDRIAGMLHRKRSLAESVLASGEAALTELSDAELAELVGPGGAR